MSIPSGVVGGWENDVFAEMIFMVDVSASISFQCFDTGKNICPEVV